MAAWELRIVALATQFSILALVIFLLKFILKSASKSTFFSLRRRDPVLELQIATFCGAYVRNSFAFCNSLFADRSGVAASRFLVVTAACVIWLCFLAESCKSHCNGGLRVANAALAAKFFDFGTSHFPFKIPFKKCFKIDVFSVSTSSSGIRFGAANRCKLWSLCA